MRITNKDMKQSVNKIFDRDEREVDDPIENQVYNYNEQGSLIEAGSDAEIFATKFVSKDRTIYKLSINRRSRLRNPHDKMLCEESVRLGKQKGQTPYYFVDTNKIAFESYLKFLQTKNVVDLTFAQRRYQ